MSNAEQKLKDAAHDVKNAVKDTADDVKNAVKDAAHDAKNKVEDADTAPRRRRAKNAVQDAAHDAKNRVQDATDDASNYIVTSVLLAFVGAVILIALLRLVSGRRR